MTRPLPFTKASVRRAVAAAESAGFAVRAIGSDGSVIVEKRGQGLPPGSATVQSDPYVAAVMERGGDAKASGKRHAGP